MEVTREEFTGCIERLHDKMDENQKSINKSILTMTVAVTKIQTRMDDLKIPDAPVRPCSQLKYHLEKHRELKESKKPWVVAGIVTLFVIVREPV